MHLHKLKKTYSKEEILWMQIVEDEIAAVYPTLCTVEKWSAQPAVHRHTEQWILCPAKQLAARNASAIETYNVTPEDILQIIHESKWISMNRYETLKHECKSHEKKVWHSVLKAPAVQGLFVLQLSFWCRPQQGHWAGRSPWLAFPEQSRSSKPSSQPTSTTSCHHGFLMHSSWVFFKP
jgi:hypothetical protein